MEDTWEEVTRDEAVAQGDVATAEVAAIDAVVVAEGAATRIIPIIDRYYAYLRGATFAEFTAIVAQYGSLLRSRYAETRVTPAQQNLVARYPDTLHVLALVAEGDPDTLAVLPIVARLLDSGPRLDLRILIDEESVAPLAQLLPDVDVTAALEEWDLPQFFCFDDDWELQGPWGPRPAAVEERLEAWLASHPELIAEEETGETPERDAALTQELVYAMRVWYNSGAAKACLEEWYELLLGLLPADDPAQTEEMSA